LRLGVTGLSRAGKTIFITSLIDHLRKAAKLEFRDLKNPLPVFRVHAEGRLTRGELEPQPDDAVPRFAYEDHLAALEGKEGNLEARHWPQSTRQISELRLRLDFSRKSGQSQSLILDIIDYPGEWILDLPLLNKTYGQWSRETIAISQNSVRAQLSAKWLDSTRDLDPKAKAEEEVARNGAELFTAYLHACRSNDYAFSTLPPGRFLMPGDLAGTPALTFAPLPVDEAIIYSSQSLAGMMERRFEAYKTHVVLPFFRDHFARLDRQIVLVDTLAALNAGPAAVRDLENALSEVLLAFRAGRNTLFSHLFRPKIDRILFAATKADHLHHTSHDRLEAILRHLTARAISRAESTGATIDVIALAAVRATREAKIKMGHEGDLDAVIGIPIEGERIGDETFDGKTEAAIFPGQLPSDPAAVFLGETSSVTQAELDYRFVRFRPPLIKSTPSGALPPLPHIRLDRALEFLIGDRLL
jgi:predicted YcjX-like family ATPase